MNESSELEFCRALSIAVHEPIGGSAVESTTTFVALQHEGPWGAKAVAESNLPASVRARLSAWETQMPGVRVQLIRRDRPDEARTLLVGCTELGRARVVARKLHDPEDLVLLDLPAVVAALRSGAPVPDFEQLERPQLLVCTNGRRDRCCAKWGLALYRKLAEIEAVDTWQTTHLGGHRFAATLLWLPAGICLGRVEQDEVDELAMAVAHGEIHRIDRFRGRIGLSAPEQAAEAEWRRRGGITRVAALEHSLVEATGPDAWHVRLTDASGRAHDLRVMREPTGEIASASCGKPPGPVWRWRFET